MTDQPMTIQPMTIHWQDAAIFLLGTWLLSPFWLMPGTLGPKLAFSIILVAETVMLCSWLSMVHDRRMADCVLLACGLWLVAAPQVLGYWREAALADDHALVGTLVAVLALSGLATRRRRK